MIEHGFACISLPAVTWISRWLFTTHDWWTSFVVKFSRNKAGIQSDVRNLCACFEEHFLWKMANFASSTQKVRWYAQPFYRCRLFLHIYSLFLHRVLIFRATAKRWMKSQAPRHASTVGTKVSEAYSGRGAEIRLAGGCVPLWHPVLPRKSERSLRTSSTPAPVVQFSFRSITDQDSFDGIFFFFFTPSYPLPFSEIGGMYQHFLLVGGNEFLKWSYLFFEIGRSR